MKKRAKKPAQRRASAAAIAGTAAPVSVVILAAGQGKRMNSDLPKVLQPLAGRPLLQHVLDTAAQLQPAALHVVYGHGGDAVRAACTDPAIQWSLQAEQRGTGHALLQAMPGIPDDHQVLVLYGDVPLLRAADAARAAGAGCRAGLSLLTVNLADPAGYGRVLRDARGRVRAIVEQKDATAAQRRVREANTGVMVLPAKPLKTLAGRPAQRQCAGRVLPHRCHRHGREGQMARGAAGGRQRIRSDGRQRQAAAGAARGRVSGAACRRGHARRRHAGRPRAFRPAWHAQAGSRCVHRRQCAVRGQCGAGGSRARGSQLRAARHERRRRHGHPSELRAGKILDRQPLQRRARSRGCDPMRS